MSKQDIYSVSGTVQSANGLYISRNADRELLALTRAGEFAYILTTRQLGKSSLMIHTAQQLHREGVRNVIIDLGQIGVGVSQEEWYLGLLAEIEHDLNLTTSSAIWFREHSQLGMIQRMTTFFEEVLLKETTDRVVIFVDEIDTTLSLNFTDDFFAAIRYFYNARAHVPEFKRLSFVLIGTAAPSDLIRDRLRTPFNIGQQVDLRDFTFEEALPLAAGFGLKEEHARQVLRTILNWTNGHPYLTQRICKELAEQQRENWSPAEVDDFVRRTFLRPGTMPDKNLVFVRDMLTKRTPNLTSVLTTYQKIRAGRETIHDEVQSIPKNHLKLSGIVLPNKLGEKTVLQLRNRIYNEVFNERWTSEHLPIDWLKRARQAGLLLAVIFLISSLGVLGVFSWLANEERKRTKLDLQIVQRDRDQAKQDLEKAIQDRIDRETGPSNYLELQKHALEPPESTRVLFESKTRGSLKYVLYGSDSCILIQRTGPEGNPFQSSTWVTAPPRDTQPSPGDALGGVQSHARDLPIPQFIPASFILSEATPAAAFGRCLNPHPSTFTSWYGPRNGCWLSVYRKWRDGCEHYQWFNTCHGFWDPGIHWTSCVH